MDIEDLGFGCLFITIGILVLALIGTGIYAIIHDINKDNNKTDYQKCICEKVEE